MTRRAKLGVAIVAVFLLVALMATTRRARESARRSLGEDVGTMMPGRGGAMMGGMMPGSPGPRAGEPAGGGPGGMMGGGGGMAGMGGAGDGSPVPMARARRVPSDGKEMASVSAVGAMAYAAAAPVSLSRKVVMSAEITLETTSFERTYSDAIRVAWDMGGYVAESGLSLPTKGRHDGRITLRVPQEQYDRALVRLKRLGKVLAEAQSAEDVTERYVDLEARLRNVKAQEVRVLDIMARARTLRDTLAVEARLTEVREQIETLEGQFRYLKFQVSMATITLTLAEKATIRRIQPPMWTAGKEFARAWGGVVALWHALASMAIYLFAFSVFWLPALGVVWYGSRCYGQAQRRARDGAEPSLPSGPSPEA